MTVEEQLLARTIRQLVEAEADLHDAIRRGNASQAYDRTMRVVVLEHLAETLTRRIEALESEP